MIPQEKCAAVTRALRETFGVDECEEIRLIRKAVFTSMVYRIVVRGSAYLLRIVTRAFDNSRHYANMKAAAEAGLAPQVRYTNNDDLVSITDFIQVAPFPIGEALTHIPQRLRALHALEPFPEVPKAFNTTCTFLVNEGPALDGFLAKFHEANLLSANEYEELFRRYEQAVDVYRRIPPDPVSSHNDLKPENVVFDGRHAWLVDWEAAGLNDRYSDLAVLANFLTTNEEEERAYLRTYFGQEPNDYQLGRFYVMRQISHMFYAMGYLFLSSFEGTVTPNGPTPEFVDFHRRIWSGEMPIEDKQTRMTYGRLHLERLFQNTRTPRFAEALAVIS